MISVLHVEPDASFRDLVKIKLEETDHNFRVESVAGTVDALTKSASNKNDVVLIGHSSNLNALDLAKSVKSISRAKIIVYTIESNESISNQVLDVGADAYLILERHLEQPNVLVRRIKTVLEKTYSKDLAYTVLDSGICAVAVQKRGMIIYHNAPFDTLVSGTESMISGRNLTNFISGVEGQALLEKGGEGPIEISKITGDKIVCWAKISNSQLLGEAVTIVNIEKSHMKSLYERQFNYFREYGPKILKSQTLTDLAKNSIEAFEGIIESEVTSFMIVEGEELVCVERHWKATSVRLPLIDDNYLTRSVREGLSINLNDPSKDRTPFLDISPNSVLIVPVKDGDLVKAVLEFRSSKANAFSDVDINVIENLCIFVGCTFKLFSEYKARYKSESQYQGVLNSLSELVLITVGSQVSYINWIGAKLLGYKDPSDLVGIDLFNCIAPEYLEEIKSRIEKLPIEGVTENYEIKLVKKDGSTILIEVNSSKIAFNGKDGFLLVGKDVSSLKEMQEHLKNYTNDLEKQIEKRTQELLEMQQFASAGKIASMVGHDLRSPLQSIRNATYLLRKQPERSEEILKSVDLSVDRALSMLEELRYKTRETPLIIKATDLHDLIVDILQDIPIPGSVKVNVRLDSELKEVEIDSLKIRRVIDNLVRNAIEAMPTGGMLTIETQSKGEAYAVIITDTGVGIPEVNLPSLFKPFYTTKEKGLGLGLAYSLKTVEAHGGIIEVDSKVGKGTEFRILLNKHPIVKTAEEKKK